MNADSVKAKLKNFAVKKGCTFSGSPHLLRAGEDNLPHDRYDG